MTILGGDISSGNVDSGSLDTPALARADILSTVQKTNLLMQFAGDSDSVNHVGTGPLQLGAQQGGVVFVSNGGGAVITGFGDPGGRTAYRFVRFAPGITLEHGPSLVLPEGSDIVTNGDDVALVIWGEALSRWVVISFWPRQMQIATVAEIRAGTAAGKIITLDRYNQALVEVPIPYGATTAVDASLFINGIVTLTGNTVMGNVANRASKVGHGGEIRINNSGGGQFAVSWASGWHFTNGEVPPHEPGENLYSYYHANAAETWVAHGGGRFGTT